jgi:hypothetical protein
MPLVVTGSMTHSFWCSTMRMVLSEAAVPLMPLPLHGSPAFSRNSVLVTSLVYGAL